MPSARLARQIPALSLPILRHDQAAIALHPARIKILTMGRRWGKTMLGLVLVLNCARNGGRVAWVVPVYRNGNALWRAAKAAVGSLKRAGLVRVNENERLIEFPRQGGFLAVYSADNGDALRGEWFNLVVLDEAARIAEDVYTDVIQPTLADAQGDLVLISTPKGRNWFWREWQRGIQDGVQIASFTAPTAANPNPRIKQAAVLAQGRVPESTYRQEWLAEFVDQAAAVWLRGWVTRYDATDPALPRLAIGRWLSYDTAFKDSDTSAYTACVVGDLLPDYRLPLRHVWRDRLLFPSLVDRIRADVQQWDADGKLRGVLIEDKASGTSAYQTLMAQGDDRLRRLLVPFMPHGSKEQRFDQAGVWVKNGSVLLPHPSPVVPWLLAFEAEVFEEGDFKDQRDATAQLVLYLEHLLAEGFAARGRTTEEPETLAV